MTAAFIDVRGLRYVRGGRVIFNNLNCQILRGETVALLGENGAGKSTLLRLLSGLLLPTDGKVMINGDEHFKQAQHMRIVEMLGYAPDVPPLYMYDTVQHYLEFIVSLKSIPQVESKAALQEVYEVFELTTFLHKRIISLSKGMQQRVNLAQACLGKPSLLIFDEPTNALDAQQTVNFYNYLSILQKAGCTIVMATHLYASLLNACHCVLKLNERGLEKFARPDLSTTTVEYHDYING